MSFQATANASVSMTDSTSGSVADVTGQANLVPTIAQVELDVVLAPAAADVPVAFPVGLTTALVAGVKAIGMADLKVKAIAAGTDLEVPQGAVLTLFNVDDVLLSSVTGGLVKVIIAG